MRLFRLALWPAALALGVAAESAAYGWDAPGDWVPDLATGWVVIACGLVAWSRGSTALGGPLLTLTGFAWFAPNFATADSTLLSWLAAHALYLHRGPLVHLVVTYPRGGTRGRLDAAIVVAGYLAAVITPVWRTEPVAIALAGSLFAAVAWSRARATGRERHERAAAVRAGGLLAIVIAATAAVRLGTPGPVTADWTLLAYEIALVVIAVALLVIPQPGAQVATVTDLVVELGETRSGTLRHALARALGDPSLELGYWLTDEQIYVDAGGRRLEVPTPDGERAVTRVDWEGQAVAALVHDRAVLDDPGLLEAVGSSARLAASNARLQAEVRAQVSEVAASRLRLLRARDEERRRLEARLREGAETRLETLRSVLSAAGRAANQETGARVERARERLDGTLADLRELASGLHPRELVERGLEQALAHLAERSPTPVGLELSLEPLPFEVEAALYFVCAEALANVTKYASASRVQLIVTVRDGSVAVDVRDDGVGGADPAAGRGLSGLADRIGALGGTFRVDSPAGGGTHLHAELPRG